MYYAAGQTDVGVTRSQNQDAIFVCNSPLGPLPNLFIVADGMGGHKAGDIASNLAVEEFTKFIRDCKAKEFIQPDDYLDLLISAAQTAGRAIAKKAEADENLHGMGTTLTACVIANDKAFIAHIGDSRAYAVSQDSIRQLTTDHTFVNELLQTGRVSEAEAKAHPKRHVLTKALGTKESAEVDGLVRDIGGAAAVLLCSDGLSNMVEEQIIMNIVTGLGYVEHRTKYLIEKANENGGKDNISAVLIDVGR
jgi:protein phosphatase